MRILFILVVLLMFSCSIEEVELENFPDIITITNLHQSLGIDINIENSRIAAAPSGQTSISILRTVQDLNVIIQTFTPIPDQLEIDFLLWRNNTHFEYFADNNVYIMTNLDEGTINGEFTYTFLGADPPAMGITGDVFSGNIQLSHHYDKYDVDLSVITSRINLTKPQHDWSTLVTAPDQIKVTLYGYFDNNYSGFGSFMPYTDAQPNEKMYYFDVNTINNTINFEQEFRTGNIFSFTVEYLANSTSLKRENYVKNGDIWVLSISGDPIDILPFLATQRLNIIIPEY